MKTISDPSQLNVKDNVQLPRIFFMYKDGKFREDEYFVSGLQYISQNEYEVFGKIEKFDNQTNYYLKSYKGGRTGETVPDPYGSFFKESDLSTVSNQMGTRICEYLQVKQEIFEYYQNYLETRSPIWFKYVERAILNGERL